MSDAALTFDLVDVFAREPFAGNQLAVVHGAAGLPDAVLLALAREFNFSETTFPTPLDAGRYRCRIFTPGGELPFAGHPTLGTAWVLRRAGLLSGPEVVQECGAGEITVRFGSEDQVELEAGPRDRLGPLEDVSVEALLHSIGLTAADRAGDAWIAGAGLSFVHLPVTDAAVARAVLGRQPVRAITALPATTDPLEGINLYAAVPAPDHLAVHSRVFVPGLLGAEDPATGSAAAGLGIALQARGLLGDGERCRIAQGAEVGRPSELGVSISVDSGTVSRVRVAGHVHPVARGEIRRP